MSIPPAAQGLLADVAAGVAAGSDVLDLLVGLLAPVARIAGADAAAVRVLDERGQRMRLLGDVGLPQGMREADSDRPAGCGACGAAMQADRLLWSDDPSECARHGDALLAGTGWRCMLAVPLSRRGRVLGVYNLFFSGLARPTPEVQALLGAIGNLLGLALDNARLEQEHLAARAREERQAMAADVHDSIAQSLSFVKMRLPLLRDAITAHEADRALRYCEDVRATVGDAHAGLRRILADARDAGSSADPLGLVHAVRDLMHGLGERTGIAFDLADEAGELHLEPQRQNQALHVVQEALANVVRHAGARHVRLRVGLREGAVELCVDDDGSGVVADAGQHGSHYGVDIMKSRAQRLGGELDLGPRPDGPGTRVRLRFPLLDAERAAAGAATAATAGRA